jgi:hypothetical protein
VAKNGADVEMLESSGDTEDGGWIRCYYGLTGKSGCTTREDQSSRGVRGVRYSDCAGLGFAIPVWTAMM